MTDRIAELGRLDRFSTLSLDDRDDESDRLLAPFNREAEAIEKVLDWADGVIANAPVMQDASEQLDKVENKLHAVRRRMKKIADENRQFVSMHRNRRSTVLMRMNRYTKLGKDVIEITDRLSAAREAQRTALANSLKQAVKHVNPRASDVAVDAALRSGRGLEAVFVDRDRGSATIRRQIDDIRRRNADIQGLVRSVQDLNQMFQDMTLLVEQQQDVINNVDFEVQEVKKNVVQASEQLEKAHNYGKKTRKRKICIISVIVIFIVLIVMGIVAYLRLTCVFGCHVNVRGAPAAPAAGAVIPASARAPVFSLASDTATPPAGPVSAAVTAQRVLDRVQESGF